MFALYAIVGCVAGVAFAIWQKLGGLGSSVAVLAGIAIAIGICAMEHEFRKKK